MSAQADVFFDRSLDYRKRSVLAFNANKNVGINADATNASEAVRDIVGQDFELLGTNAISADVTLDTTGGFKLATHGGSVDSAIMLPHLTAAMSAWTSTLWDTAKQPTFDTVIKTGTVITLAKYWMGYKLTNTPTLATDADQVLFTYSSALGAGQWQYNYTIGGATAVVYTVPLDVVAKVALSTVYNLRIEIYSDRTHMGFINDRPIASSVFPILTSLTTFIPYHGVISLTDATVKSFTIKRFECSRLY